MTLAAFYGIAWAEYLTDSPEPNLWSTSPEADGHASGDGRGKKFAETGQML